MDEPKKEVDSDVESDSEEQKTEQQFLDVAWTPDHENILVEWADKALCYKWLHAKSHTNYSRANAWFTIPVIIMSTITGTANFAQERFSEDIKPYIAMGIGGVNIFAGILTTIAQYLKISELNEAHRVSSISWDKFYRNIKVELAKAPPERVPVLQMLKIAKEEYDRLMETSPAVSEKITQKFKDTFENEGIKSGCGCSSNKSHQENLEMIQSARRAAYESLKKPEICGALESTRNAVYKPREAPEESALTLAAIGPAQRSIALKQRKRMIEKFIEDFTKQRGRAPTKQEIKDEVVIDIKPVSSIKNKQKNNAPQGELDNTILHTKTDSDTTTDN